MMGLRGAMSLTAAARDDERGCEDRAWQFLTCLYPHFCV